MILLVLLLTAGFVFSMTLEEMKETALKNNIEVVKGDLDLKKLEERIREVRAGVLPTLTFSARYTKWDPDYISSFVPENKYLLTLSLNQSIFDKSVWDALKVANRSRELQDLILEEVKVKILAEVEKLYWTALAKREILREMERSLAYWKNYYALAREQFKSGIIPRFEFLRARAQFRQAKANLLRAENDYRRVLNSLKTLLGISQDIQPQGEMRMLEPPPETSLEETNPTLRVLAKTIELKKDSVSLKRSAYYPKLSFFFNYNYENIMDFRNGRLQEDNRYGYNFGLQLNMTLFNGFGIQAQVAQERIDLSKASEEYAFTRNKIMNELDTLRRTLQSTREEVLAMKDSLEASEESLKYVTERYKEGVGTQIDLLDARRSYERSKIALIEAILRYNSVVVDIKSLLGQ